MLLNLAVPKSVIYKKKAWELLINYCHEALDCPLYIINNSPRLKIYTNTKVEI